MYKELLSPLHHFHTSMVTLACCVPDYRLVFPSTIGYLEFSVCLLAANSGPSAPDEWLYCL